jgi:hypothetical protein
VKALGIILIIFGMCAGVGAASTNMRNEAQGMPPDQRFGQAVGGALCSLTLVVGGVLLALRGDRKPADRRYRRPPETDHDDDPE